MTFNDWKEREPDGTFKCNVRTHQFESLADCLDYVEARPEGSMVDAGRRYGCNSMAPDRQGWSGGHSWEQCLRMAREGWPEGLKLVEAITAKFEHITASKLMRPQVAYDVAGDCVDVGRYVTGEPENMMIWEEAEIENAGKIVRIEANLSASSGISAAQMAIRGAAVCALVDALEQCGKSVELTLCFATKGGRRRMEFYVPVKQAGEPLEMDRLAFMMAHAGMFRRIGFACLENAPEQWRQAIGVEVSGDYGIPASCKGAGTKADIVAPHMLLNGDAAACVQWVFQTLKEQGISIDGV